MTISIAFGKRNVVEKNKKSYNGAAKQVSPGVAACNMCSNMIVHDYAIEREIT